MTLQEFITKWTGKFAEISGPTAKNQCVDLVNQYIQDVLELSIIPWTNAVDFPSKAGDKYDYILNTPEGVPQAGDIVVWGPPPGHIVVFIDGNTRGFNSFDQNYPIGSPCHIQNHPTYFNVKGWLRKKENQVIKPLEYKLNFQDKIDLGVQDGPLDWNKNLGEQVQDLKLHYDIKHDNEETIKGLSSKVTELENTLEINQQVEMKAISEEIELRKQAENILLDIQTKYTKTKERVELLEGAESDYSAKITKLETELKQTEAQFLTKPNAWNDIGRGLGKLWAGLKGYAKGGVKKDGKQKIFSQ